MIQEFIFQHKVFAIRRAIEKLNPDEEKICFPSLLNIQLFIKSAIEDPNAREDIINIADWILIPSRTDKKNLLRSQEEMIDLLCQKIYNGDLLLVEIKLPEPKLKFEKCCLESMKAIENTIQDFKILGVVLCIGQVHRTLGSHPGIPNTLSALSSLAQIHKQDWSTFAEAVAAIPKVSRGTVAKIAALEYFKHNDEQNNRELGKYWKRIYDGFNQ